MRVSTSENRVDVGAVLIAAERRRHVLEGWTSEHDDEHDQGELAKAAACYALPAANRMIQTAGDNPGAPLGWPWDAKYWKPTADRIRELVKAGSLIAAEIDRLDRNQDTGTTVDTLPDEIILGYWQAYTDTEPPPPQRSRVPDLPCPKCGSDDVTLSYQRGCGPSCNAGGVEHREHFRRYCPRCSYAWLTTDILDAEEGK